MRSLALLALLSTCTITHAGDFYVTDGDTVRQAGVSYRIVGLNAPELHAQCDSELKSALQAKARLVELRPSATLTPVLCAGDHVLDLYGRHCAKIAVTMPDGSVRDWADIAIAEKLAEPYVCTHGHCPRRRDWCANPLR
jgi:endonuclease YncB( thermonuclease family)